MSGSLYITKSCIIRDNRITVDNVPVFELTGATTTEFRKAAYHFLSPSYAKFYKMDILGKLGFLCSEILINGRDLNREYEKEQTSIILSNSSSSLDTDRNFQRSVNDRSNYFPSPSVFVYTLPNLAAGEICIRHKLYGENIFFITENFDACMMHSYIRDIFASGITECCIAGWLEADLRHYDSMFCLIEKRNAFNNGITIFDVDTLEKIYSRNI